MNSLTVSAVLFSIVVLTAFSFAQEPENLSPPEPGRYSRSYGPINQSRSVVYATQGMACTSDPRATKVALDILQSGGNAVDAAIAANAMLGVVEPMSNGIGGDLFAIVWDAKTKKLYGLNASGRSPKKLDISTVRAAVEKTEDQIEIPKFNPIAWSVPGCVSGWQLLHEKFGSVSVEQILSPSVKTASEGFPVAPIIAGHWKSALQRISTESDPAGIYLLDGNRTPAEGDMFRNPALAKTYQRLIDDGLGSFYQGAIANDIVEFSHSVGGFLSANDLTSHSANWVEPVSVQYRGHKLWELPPNGQGIAALQILAILEQHDVAAMGWGSAEYLHLWTEAKKLAFADRAQFYADMSMADVPVTQLISTEYAQQQNKRIDLSTAATQIDPGDPKLVNGDTIYLTVVDKDRNCISLIQSNYYGFGSGFIPPTLGFAIQNRGALFTLEEGHPNQYAPNKRPFHTIIPAMVTKENRPVLSFGVMGGDMQPQGHSQVLCNWLDFKMNIQMAGDAARVRHDGSATPTGVPMETNGGTLFYEQGIPATTLEKLESMGHTVAPRRTGMGGYQAIEIDWQRGILKGATESRTDGFAQGY